MLVSIFSMFFCFPWIFHAAMFYILFLCFFHFLLFFPCFNSFLKCSLNFPWFTLKKTWRESNIMKNMNTSQFKGNERNNNEKHRKTLNKHETILLALGCPYCKGRPTQTSSWHRLFIDKVPRSVAWIHMWHISWHLGVRDSRRLVPMAAFNAGISNPIPSPAPPPPTGTFHTKLPFDQKRFTSNSSTVYTKYLLHHSPLAPNNFYAEYLPHVAAFAQEDFYTSH